MSATSRDRNRIGTAGRVAHMDVRHIHVGWSVGRICILSALLLLFNRYPDRIGVVVSAGDPSTFVPLLSPEFLEQFLLRLNVWWGLTVALDVVNLYAGRWLSSTRLLDCALAFFGMFIIANAIASQMVGVNPEWVQAGQSVVASVEKMVPLLTWLVRGGLAVALMAWLAMMALKLQALSKAVVPSAA
ncbi:MAG TPA: hypothetical protein VM537_30100 [Anaerolineae bacterium]|nr:hypothetical protein [Anaerolineae bacterium]